MQDERFVQEVHELEGTLYRIARTFLRSDADCCDAVQEALTKAWKHRECIKPERFRAYLTRILVNECHNIGRQRARVTVVEEIPERTEEKGDGLEVQDALMRLKREDRLILVMVYMEEFRLKEAASVLHMPLGTVKYRLFRARKAFKHEWNEGGART